MSLASEGTYNVKLILLLKALEQIKYGSLRFALPSGEIYNFKGDLPGYDADMKVNDMSCLGQFISHGDIGLGETYMKGLWDTDDLPSTLSFFVQNIEAIEEMIHGKKLIQFLLWFGKLFSANTRRGSKKNIYKHYDLGNDFYKFWLDESMTYSSALYNGIDKDLTIAQGDKYSRILQQLPENSQNILEIGCGWGGFAEQAGISGLNVDAITISKSQADFAKKRMKEAKLAKNVSIKIQDYRDVRKQYDSIVSIEMFEAVGREYWNRYFSTLKRSLSEKGKAVIQTITIGDDVFEGYKNRTDFIQKHIFPGGMLSSNKVFNELATKFNLNISDSYSFGSCYAKTLSKWLDNFEQAKGKVKSLGFDEEFMRKWSFYLSYCIAGFVHQRTDVVQYTLEHKSR